MSTESKSAQIGPGWLDLLALLLIGLKLTGHITISWWWVLAPLWIPVALVLVVFTIGAIVVTARHVAGR